MIDYLFDSIANDILYLFFACAVVQANISHCLWHNWYNPKAQSFTIQILYKLKPSLPGKHHHNTTFSVSIIVN